MTGRFKKGQSGNPKGRPKGKRAERLGSAVDIIVDRTLAIRKNGRLQEVSVEEALQHQTYLKAVEGDKTSRRELLKMIQRREASQHKKAQPTSSPVVTRRIEPTDPENANEAMLIVGIATVNQQHGEISGHEPPLHLETWAVPAALGRRRGGTKLSHREIKEINRCARDPAKIKWPRGTKI